MDKVLPAKISFPPRVEGVTYRFLEYLWFGFQPEGTAILSKDKAVSVDKTFPGHPDPNSAKVHIITLEINRYRVIGTYVVDAGQEKIAVVLADDLNAAPLAIGRPKKPEDKLAGWSYRGRDDGVREHFKSAWEGSGQILRHLAKTFTQPTTITLVLGERVVDRLKTCEIRSEIYGAHHCPIVPPEVRWHDFGRPRDEYIPEGERVFEALRALATKLRTKRAQIPPPLI
ncbi:hypothetical protein BC826DRAFT_1175636 [Russula brevipes]|nr:hypothetical protein BC826DRAFT_1175636 [Russula brevipes]